MTVNLAFSSDNNYAPFLCVALFSLLNNSNKNNTYHIYILDGGLSQTNVSLITDSLNKFTNKRLNFVKIDQKIFKNIKPILHLNQTSYYRLLLPDILPKVNKIIYLDCDILVLKDISLLFRVNLSRKVIGCCSIFHPNYRSVLQKIYPHLKLNTVINAGVAVMDLRQMRKFGYTDKFIDFVNSNSAKLLAGDQDVLNIILINKIKLLPATWNYSSYLYVSKNRSKIITNPAIVHFDGIKPWASGSVHPYKKLFYMYLSQTRFKNYHRKFNLEQYIKNMFFYLGNRIANILPRPLYDIIEKEYLKNNFLEKKYRQILKNENN